MSSINIKETTKNIMEKSLKNQGFKNQCLLYSTNIHNMF